MELQKHFVAFIDILGFASYVKDNKKEPDKPLELLKQFIKAPKLFKFNLEDKIKITAFSDSIVVSMLAKDPIQPFNYDTEYIKFILYINSLQTYIITGIGKLPIRGSVTYGDFYRKGSELLFGEAMIEAYDLERLHAYFPRIVVNAKFLDPHRIIDAYNKLSTLTSIDFTEKYTEFNLDSEQLLRTQFVAYDYDGILFCNYLSCLYILHTGWAENCESSLNIHKNYILFNLKVANEKNDINILRKYTWMKSYHNWFCKPFKEFQKFIISN